jgi:hypothetical protein
MATIIKQTTTTPESKTLGCEPRVFDAGYHPGLTSGRRPQAMSNIHADATPHKSRDQFTSDQFKWLRQVAADSDLSPVASRVAIALTKYFSRKSEGWSWMAQETIADDLDLSLRTVSSAFTGLVRRGHLLVKRRGMKETNEYHLALKSGDSDTQETAHHDTQEPAHQDGVIRKSTSSDTQIRVKVIRKNLRTNPLIEPTEEPIEEEDSPPTLDFGEDGRRESDPPSGAQKK